MKILHSQRIAKYSENWYSFGHLSVPELGTTKFLKFIASGSAFIYKLNPTNEKTFSLKFDSNIQTAYVNFKDQVIGISPQFTTNKYFEDNFPESRPETRKFMAVAIINGLIIHESLHILFTKNSEGTYFDSINESLKNADAILFERLIKLFSVEFLCKIHNILEDIFIEHNCPHSTEFWIEILNDVLLNKDLSDKILAIENPVKKQMALMGFWMNPKWRDLEIFDQMDEFVKIGCERMTLPTAKSYGERRLIALNLAQDLFHKYPEDVEAIAPPTLGDHIGFTHEDLETIISDLTAEQVKQGIKDFSEEYGDHIKSSETTFIEMSELIENESREVSLRESSFNSEAVDGIQLRWKDPVVVDVMSEEFCFRFAENEAYWERIEYTEGLDMSFITDLKSMMTFNSTPGRALEYGTRMVKSRLTRVATDKKIFARRDSKRRTKKEKEVIINIDLSGSTRGEIVSNEIGTAREMSKSLMEARIPHSIYGHTALHLGQAKTPRSEKVYTPIIIHIFSFNMKENNHDWEERFEAICDVHLAENMDGLVIQELAKKFKDDNAKRYMINLSDGSPRCPGYSGRAGVEHTRQIIEKVRKERVEVFAFSVIKEVVKANDIMYLKRFNIDGSKNSNQEFKKLLQSIFS